MAVIFAVVIDGVSIHYASKQEADRALALSRRLRPEAAITQKTINT